MVMMMLSKLKPFELLPERLSSKENAKSDGSSQVMVTGERTLPKAVPVKVMETLLLVDTSILVFREPVYDGSVKNN